MRPPYPRYRDSGVEWLDDVPEHWEVKPLSMVITEIRQLVDPSELDDLLVEHYSIPAIEATGKSDLTSPDKILSNKQLLQGGEVMVSKLNPRKARVLQVLKRHKHTAIASTDFIIIRPDDIDGSYLVYLLLAEPIRQHMDSCVQSVTRSHQRIRPEHLLETEIGIPDRETQWAIAEFLNRETERIDKLVAKKRLLVERLGEYRTALITRTVTCGLPPDVASVAGFDPSPRLKSSGVEWLGDVPEHWRDTFVEYCYDIQLGKMLQPEPFGSHEFETPYLKALNVQWHHINIEEPPTMWASDDDLERFGVRQGDLLVCEGGEGGRAAMLDKTLDGWIIQNALHRVRAKSHSENRFLMYWLTALAASGWLEAINNRATIAHFTKEKFGALPLLLPPLDEQRAIAEFLDRETERIDKLCSRVEIAVERLLEYRAALITAAVTGKIDVRDSVETAARVPGVRGRGV